MQRARLNELTGQLQNEFSLDDVVAYCFMWTLLVNLYFITKATSILKKFYCWLHQNCRRVNKSLTVRSPKKISFKIIPLGSCFETISRI